jgi:hypothetical protein
MRGWETPGPWPSHPGKKKTKNSWIKSEELPSDPWNNLTGHRFLHPKNTVAENVEWKSRPNSPVQCYLP